MDRKRTGEGRYRGFLAILFVCLLAFPVAAQERFGELTGVVTDSSGAAIPNASVTITNRTTNRSLVFHTIADGTYLARNLEPGRYSVRFEAKGFATYEVPDINVLLGKSLKVDASMRVGSIDQVVQVTDQSPLIDTSGTTVAHNVTVEEFDRLPKTRTFQSLALTSPSVNSGQIEGGIQVNGASGSENQFNIDGTSTNSLVDGRSRQNAVFEVLQEVQVKTGGIEAEYGGALGGVISAITKSGGNAFHGDLHYYYYGNGISAGPVKRLLLDPSTEATASFVQDDKQKDNNHEVGGSLGGYFIKDKLWFFTSASPNFRLRSNDYKFSGGTEPATLKAEETYWQLFNKLSYSPTQRLRTNFSWLWSPAKAEGRLPAYNNVANAVTSTLASNAVYQQVGYFQPQNNYSGQHDHKITPTSLVTVRGGRFWDNYKDTGVPAISHASYQVSATNLPFAIPENLRQPAGYQNTPRLQNNFHDLTTRTYVQGDYSLFGHLFGTHDLKIGGGYSKTVNNVDLGYPGEGYVWIYWDRAFRGQRGTYGYYSITNFGTRGATGAGIGNLYIQDRWRVHPRLTLSLGLRTENEVIPSFRRDIKDTAFQFDFQQKMAPRLGASWDVFGTGKLKVYGSWGRYYDWVKYELSRGTFGGDFYTIRYRALDTLDVFSLNGLSRVGRNLWTDAPDSVRDLRVPSFEAVDPNIKPMYSDVINVGVDYQLTPHTVFSARYVGNHLGRTIEDFASLDAEGNEIYVFGTPGEGVGKIASVTGATKPFPMPKAVRKYDAMELIITRRFSSGWFGSASYVFSRLYGNYAGLGNSDEITTPTTGVSSGTSQSAFGSIARPGTPTSRAWDLDEIMWDSHGVPGILGRLATDRPHVVKLYGGYTFKFGTEVAGFFYGGSGTPLSTYVNTSNLIPVFVNGRGDMGRTPFLTQTDLLVTHEVKVGEGKRVRFELNALNVFNQKTARHRFNCLNRGCGARRDSSAIDLHGVDLAKGYDYNALILQSNEGRFAYEPRYGLDDLFNPGFAGRFGVKFIF